MTKIGEFKLNKIYCMDCLEGLKKLPDNSVDLVLTDPPYNIGKDFKNDNLSKYAFHSFITPILYEYSRVIKEKHPVIIFFDAGKQFPLIMKAIENAGLYLQKVCFFYKPNDCSQPHNRILRTSEVFLICTNTPELNSEGDKYIHDVLIANHQRKEKWYHPTAKNLKVIQELILSHSKSDYIVLDSFMGSGTTAVAAKQLGRNFIGFEISPEYCKIAEERLKQDTFANGFDKFESVPKGLNDDN